MRENLAIEWNSENGHFDVFPSMSWSDVRVGAVIAQRSRDRTGVGLSLNSAHWSVRDQCLKSRPFGSGPGRLGLKIPPGRADSTENFSGPGRLGPKIPPGRAGPTWAENSPGPGRADLGRKFFRAGPIPKKQVWRKMTPKLVKNTLNWLQNPPKLGKGPSS